MKDKLLSVLLLCLASLMLTACDSQEKEIKSLIQQLDVKGQPVAESLAEIGEPAIPHLIRVLAHENEKTRMYAAFALIKIGEPAVPVLMKALTHESKYVRGEAAATLGAMDAKVAIPALERAVASWPPPDWPRNCAAEALRILREADKGVVQNYIEAQRQWRQRNSQKRDR